MGVSSKPTSRKHFRSITLPCRSHPSTDRIQKVLNKVKTWESISSLSNPSAEIVCSGLSQLTELYECLDDLFKTSLSQNLSISSNHTTKFMDELLDASVKFLDICSITTDVMSQTKEHLRDLGCDLRRKGTGSSIESTTAKYIVFRNKLRKDIKGSVASLKQMDNMICCCRFKEDDSENHHLTSVIQAFRDVKAFTIVIFRLLLVFLATPLLKRRPGSRWTAVSRFLSSGKVVPEEKADDSNANELQRLDAALFRYCTSDKQEFIQIVKKKIEVLEATLEVINSHLDLISKRLIATRVSLLNMVSFY
ncbi:uncharacterized protein LOC112515766 [Cynara cardunculus var. scolymus]|uniref:Uncharacterized protein n=1 Tax=Cynara cardunculus var. scolymus TaxID=59895 RepID=A0A118JV49_CYNCS|nr:uncharacterized protein LOC112515766 [Cynara cardunculus var. scolymus]KVH92247.1 Protein of unknown function DUF241, plant [Cynara cardunculus var. scolymus]